MALRTRCNVGLARCSVFGAGPGRHKSGAGKCNKAQWARHWRGERCGAVRCGAVRCGAVRCGADVAAVGGELRSLSDKLRRPGTGRDESSSMKERRSSQKVASKSGSMDPNQNVKCKIVVVGDSQCGKTALLHVFAKDSFPENYVPTVFENYTASFEIDTQRIELSLWDTSGSPYYDNVRPLSYPDSDAVLICFDISRPETLDSVLKKWKGEIQEFCPNTKMLLVGCKSDLRTDLTTLVELSNHRQTPVSYDQGANMAKQIGAATYIECSALQSENSVRDIFHVATLACVNKSNKNLKRNKTQRTTKRISHMPSRPELTAVATDLRKDKAKSCSIM